MNESLVITFVVFVILLVLGVSFFIIGNRVLKYLDKNSAYQEDFEYTLGETLKNSRKNVDMTEDEVADHFKVTAMIVSSWEDDTLVPNNRTLLELEKIYNISLQAYLKEDTIQ